MDVAFLGMGVMGKYMASRLVQSVSFKNVRVWNRTENSEGLAFAKQNGCEVFETAEEAVANCEFVCLCLGDGESVKGVLKRILPALDPNTLIIDFTTIGRDAAVDIKTSLLSNHRFIDAPVSGGDVGAKNGELVVMVGGSQKNFVEAKPVFNCVAKKTIHCGPVGQGQAVKMVNQVLCGIHMVALCEGLKLADELGVDEQTIVEVCSQGAAGSWALQNLGPMICKEDFSPGFMVKHMLKDLRINQEAINQMNSSFPGFQTALDNFEKVFGKKDQSGPDLGTQAMYKLYHQRN